MKGKLIILEGQIAVKMKENDARGKQKVYFFLGRLAAPKRVYNPLILNDFAPKARKKIEGMGGSI